MILLRFRGNLLYVAQPYHVKKPCQGSASLLCYCVTGNSRWRLAVESSPAKRHTPTLQRPTASAADGKTALVVSKRRSCVQAVIRRRWRTQNLIETHVSVLPNPVSLQDARQ